jgi:NADPH:quinone reductase-like Zn-dependent oxidoreductase
MAWFVPQRIRPFVGHVNQHDLVTIIGLIETGKVIPVTGRTYPLSEVPEALSYLGQGHTRGKIVITT